MNSTADRLFDIARAQQGYFTSSQAIACGYPSPNHVYHLRTGAWHREQRGIYRLSRFPEAPERQYALWSIWSRNRAGEPQGVYSHQTALSLFDLSGLMPARLHMTVPPGFRRRTPIPDALVLHVAPLPAADVEIRQGYRVTRPLRAIADLLRDGAVDPAQLRAALRQALDRGLITRTGFARHPDHNRLQALLKRGAA
jgi:hypothetical protein